MGKILKNKIFLFHFRIKSRNGSGYFHDIIKKYLFSNGQKLNLKKYLKKFIFWFWIKSRKRK